METGSVSDFCTQASNHGSRGVVIDQACLRDSTIFFLDKTKIMSRVFCEQNDNSGPALGLWAFSKFMIHHPDGTLVILGPARLSPRRGAIRDVQAHSTQGYGLFLNELLRAFWEA